LALAVDGERVCAELEQQGNHRRPLHTHGEVQRRLIVFVPTHPSIERGAISGDDAPHLVAFVERDG
jgi:hypothetical protein